MARKVYMYSNIDNLKELSYFNEISKYPHIVATASMRRGLEEKYKDEIENIFDVYSIQKDFCGDWTATETVFEQYIGISALLRSMVNLPSNFKQLGESFSKNRKEIYNSIRALVEAGMFPADLVPQNDEERLFQMIWEKVEATDLSYGIFRSNLYKYAVSEESFKHILENYREIEKSDVIVLHGFYYITPIQERIFDIFEAHGKQLIFLGCIEGTNVATNQIWVENFAEVNGYEPTSEWVQGCLNNKANLFGTVFNGTDGLSPLENVVIKRYKTEAMFIKDIKRIDEDGFKLYSMDSRKTEAILKEVCPEKFKKRHLLSYPVGQYFYTLHSLWDSKTGLSIDAESIQRCFSSGWVISGNKNGRDYTHQLEMMSPFFENCHKFDDWKIRMAELKQLAATFEDTFEKHIKDMPLDNQNRHRIMSNPFLNFSFLAVDKADANAVFELISTIFQTAEDLFGDGSELDISKHFEKINKIISDGSDEASLYKEEVEIIKDISDRVSNPNFAVKNCLPEDISEAMMMIIGGGVLADDDFEALASEEEDYVQSMYQMETAPLVTQGKIHLCFADEVHLPGDRKKYTWPLNHDMLIRMCKRIDGRRAQYVKDFMFVNEKAPLANRYLFESALKNNKVELSWIEEENGKKIAESPYIRMLMSVFGCTITDMSEEEINICVDDITNKAPVTVSLNDEHSTLEERIDLFQCPWRYVYGYVTNKFPSYKSSFHFSFILSSIIGAFKITSGMPKEEVARNILDCFSYLKGIEKQNVSDFAPLIFESTDDTLDDVSYTRLRLMPHFANRTRANEAIDIYNSQSMNGSCDSGELFFTKEQNYRSCLYCQYKGECIHATLDED